VQKHDEGTSQLKTATSTTAAADVTAAAAGAAEHAPPTWKKETAFERAAHWVAKHVGHGHPEHPHGPKVITHERPVLQGSAFVGLVEVGYTFSELNQIRRDNGFEVVHVVNPDGSSNIETILRRFQPEWMHGNRFELQGPALNTSVSGPPLGARFLGFGLTGDLSTEHSKDALSYTLEVKLTEKSAVELAKLATPGIAAEVGKALTGESLGGVGDVVANVFLGAVPVISAGIALVSCKHAVDVCKDKSATKEQKAFAIGHALADLVRIVLPIPGTLMNVALVAGAAVRTGMKLHDARVAAKAAATAKATGDDG
jgi:hypothetical protein